MNINGRLETKVSNKSGKEYTVLILTFPNGYEKYVFLEPAEIYIMQSLKELK